MSQYPNLYLIGAPKCGTTSLAAMLRCCKDVYIPKVKEPHFFAADMPGPYTDYYRDEENYLSLYSGMNNFFYRGDCSVWYYRSLSAPREIKNACPSAKIIMLVRNPISMIESLYFHKLYSGDEKRKDINEAIFKKPERGVKVNWTLWGLEYLEAPRWSKWVPMWKEVFEDNFKIIVFEEFVKDPESVYKEVCDFIGVDSSDAALNHSHENASKKSRSVKVQLFMNIIPKRFKEYLAGVIGGRNKKVVTRLINKVFKEEQVDGLSQASLEILAQEYVKDIDYIRGALGKDVWSDREYKI